MGINELFIVDIANHVAVAEKDIVLAALGDIIHHTPERLKAVAVYAGRIADIERRQESKTAALS